MSTAWTRYTWAAGHAVSLTPHIRTTACGLPIAGMVTTERERCPRCERELGFGDTPEDWGGGDPSRAHGECVNPRLAALTPTEPK